MEDITVVTSRSPATQKLVLQRFSFPTDSKRKTNFNETTYHPKSTTHLEKKNAPCIILDMFFFLIVPVNILSEKTRNNSPKKITPNGLEIDPLHRSTHHVFLFRRHLPSTEPILSPPSYGKVRPMAWDNPVPARSHLRRRFLAKLNW